MPQKMTNSSDDDLLLHTVILQTQF